jgi:hypothetical protein
MDNQQSILFFCLIGPGLFSYTLYFLYFHPPPNALYKFMFALS